MILIGPMGVGKTTVGIELAARLGRPFLDSDAVLTRDLGVDGATIARRRGVAALHEIEVATLARMASTTEPSVIAAAASVVDSADGRAVLMDGVTTVWLDAEPGVLEGRRAGSTHRRSIDAEEAERLRERRRPHFTSVAALRVDTTDVAPPEVADRIVGAIEGA